MSEAGSSPDSSYDEALDEGEEHKRPGGSLLDQLQGDMRPVEEYVGQYQLGKIIGKGGFGTVHKGRNLNTGEIVAVKCFRAEKIAKENLSVVMGEAELLTRLHHPNIVKFYGYVKSRHFLYFILEYLEEGSLSKVLSDFGVIPEKLAAFYIDQARPSSNLLIAKTGEVKLADFGVSAQLNESEKRFSVVGTPYWMAPEVIEMSGHYTESDIWSVGCVALELVTGQPPYYNQPAMAAMFRIVADEHPPLPSNVSSDLADFLLQCWRKDPLERPTAKEMLNHPWLNSARQSDVQAGVASLESARSWIEDHNKEKMTGRGNKDSDSTDDDTDDDESPVATMYIKATAKQTSESEDGGGEGSEDDHGSKDSSVRITRIDLTGAGGSSVPMTPRTASKNASEKERKENEKRQKKEQKEREKREKREKKQEAKQERKSGSLIVRTNDQTLSPGAAAVLESKRSRTQSLDRATPPVAGPGTTPAATGATANADKTPAVSDAAKKLWLRLDEEMKRSVRISKEMEALKQEMEQTRAEKNDLRVKLAEIRTKNEEIATLAKASLNPDLSNDKREKMQRRLAILLKENEQSGSLESVTEADAMILRSPRSSKKVLRVGAATRLLGAERKKRGPGSWLRMGNNANGSAAAGSTGASESGSPTEQSPVGSFDLTTSPARSPDTPARDALRRSG